MARIFLISLPLVLLLLAPSEAAEEPSHKPSSEFKTLFPLLGRHEDSNTVLSGNVPEDQNTLKERTPGKLKKDFYRKTCPNVEKIVTKTFSKIVKENPGAIGHMLRLQFHDCFVNGCDASILLDFTPTGDTVEKSSMFNGLLLKGADIIDDVKTKVEEECPETVSCADIMVFTTYEAMSLAGLPGQKPLGGRRDSLISLATIAEENNLPRPDWSMDQIMELFGRKGFNVEETVVLLGGHSVGVCHCDAFMERANNFNGTGKPDPILPANVIEEIKKSCPNAGTNLYRNPPVNFDATPTVLDNLFFKDLVEKRRALILTDSYLYEDARTRPIVEQMAADHTLFPNRFPEVMAKLTALDVLTGTEGDVRKICRSLN
ncbi:unnamed protein product [Sphenostylis stenocarpa]|uniref:Peroxidase n=1 Tax=Sphenostylis stenocarpa TaxID=92480 RepID=A0AA86V979_9FABA|nr:unnamed protein product [Sphenostylis stenocarpa]